MSNNWQKYQPKFVLVEEHDFDIENLALSLIYNYLSSQNYSLVARTENNVIYRAK